MPLWAASKPHFSSSKLPLTAEPSRARGLLLLDLELKVKPLHNPTQLLVSRLPLGRLGPA